MEIGYTMLCEQTGPNELVSDVVAAEEAGFDFSVISDHYFPWLDVQGQVPNGCRQARPVAKRHVLDPDVTLASSDFRCSGRILDGGLPVQYLENVIGGIEALLHHQMNSAELFDRIVEHENSSQQS